MTSSDLVSSSPSSRPPSYSSSRYSWTIRRLPVNSLSEYCVPRTLETLSLRCGLYDIGDFVHQQACECLIVGVVVRRLHGVNIDHEPTQPRCCCACEEEDNGVIPLPQPAANVSFCTVLSLRLLNPIAAHSSIPAMQHHWPHGQDRLLADSPSNHEVHNFHPRRVHHDRARPVLKLAQSRRGQAFVQQGERRRIQNRHHHHQRRV